MRSFVVQRTHVVLHHSSVTFDTHLEETLGTCMNGGTLAVLHRDGHLDMAMFSTTIRDKQVTTLGIVPSQLTNLTTFVQSAKDVDCLKTLEYLIFGGEHAQQF